MASKKPPAKKDQITGTRNDYWKTKLELNNKGKKLFEQLIFRDWCKACGICIAFCPKDVFSKDKNGKPVIERPENCNGCLFCELHCPDFAITIREPFVDRRKKQNGNNRSKRETPDSGK